MLRRIGDFIVVAVERRSAQTVFLLIVFLLFAGIDLAIGAVAAATRLAFLEHELVDAAIHGGLAVVAVCFLFAGARERRARIRAEIEHSAQLNHEIRNALEVISHAGYLLNDVVYGRAVAESVDRIKKSLDRPAPGTESVDRVKK